MKTKHPRPMLTSVLNISGWFCFLGALGCFLLAFDRGGNYFAIAIALLITGITNFGMAEAVHLAIDSMARTAESNEQIAAFLTGQSGAASPSVPAGTTSGSASSTPPALSASPPAPRPPSAAAAPATPPASTATAPSRQTPVPPAAASQPPTQAPKPRRTEPTALCSNCQQKIAFPIAMAGQTVSCPSCATQITLDDASEVLA